MKRCGKPARLVVIEDPKLINPVCKEHGSEQLLKKMGLLYRKAKGGEKCGQLATIEKENFKALEVWGNTGSADKALKTLKKAINVKNPPRARQRNAQFNKATLDMLKTVEETGDVNAGLEAFRKAQKK